VDFHFSNQTGGLKSVENARLSRLKYNQIELICIKLLSLYSETEKDSMKKFFASVIYCFLYVVSLLPMGVHYFFSGIMAFILKNIVRYRYSVITTNIARSFPEKKYGEIKKLVSEYYQYMCDLFFESIWDLAHSADAVRKRVKVSKTEVVDDLLKEYGRVILVMGHCGNWEMVSGMMISEKDRTPDSYASNQVYMVYKAAESKLSDILFKKLRMHEYKKFHTSGEVVESKQVLRHALKNKDKKAIYIMIADQNPIGKHDPIVDFLNQKTYMLPGPDFLASRLKMPSTICLDMSLKSLAPSTIS